ncbi:MAG: glycosyltransferase family 2 protein, partial [Nanoarchaeota archaeon]
MKEKMFPFVDILIVTYNGKKYLSGCLASLQELTYPKDRYIITIIDNASSDGTLSVVEQNTNNFIKIIKNNKNLGFGKANTIGIKAAPAETKYIVLLNQDSLVAPEWLTELVDTMEKNPKAGACGATQKDYNQYKKITTGEKRIKECIWMGCGSIILRKEALDQIGYFDPYYFMYVEDIDITWRLKIVGWDILHTFNALWFHEGRDRKLT